MKHLRKFLLIGVLIPNILIDLQAQKKDSVYFQSPFNFPLFLSGNYGELRSNHFHAGIDLKTGGEIGKSVLAPASGYVSRIKIQANGYGKSIYITHPNGYTTVYGHLNQYIPAIEEYVKANQYKKHSYEIELFPPADMFTFKKGDIIAYSGNTGGSGGPHLHFEIRKTKSEVPVNGLLFKLPIVDQRNPEFKTLHLYSMPEGRSIGNNGEFRTSYHVTKINNSTFEISHTIKCSTHYIGFSTEVYDFLNSSSNRCGIYRLELTVNNRPIFSFVIDDIPFDKTRYINAHMDYELKVNENTGVHRLFRLPNNKLPIYKTGLNDGIILIGGDLVNLAEINAYDAYGNKSVLKFRFRYDGSAQFTQIPFDSTMIVKYNQDRNFHLPKLDVVIPAYSFYRDVCFSLSSVTGNAGYLGDTFNIHLSSEPLQSNITLKYYIDSIDPSLHSKLLFARIVNKKLFSEGGDWSNGVLTAEVRNLGQYIVTIDTVPPAIRSVNFASGEKLYPGRQIVFRVDDDLAGIKSYNLYIDDKWALLEYDPKTERMIYTVDKSRLTPGRTYSLKLYVMDEKNNIALFQSKFQF